MVTTETNTHRTEDEFTPAEISPNAKVVLEKRYLLKNDNGELAETPDGMFRRVADALAKVEKFYGASQEQVEERAEQFYRMMASLEFLPNSPTMMNAGTGAGTLSACFVLPLTDSMKGIMKAAHDAAMVQKFGGGTGFSLSELRPVNSPISTTHGKACGPIAALKHLSSVSSLVTQGGKRDGANMAVMSVHHPDILEFIDCKANEGAIHNFNISVGATDEFMRAVANGTDYALRHKKDPSDPESEEVEFGRLDAQEVFAKIVDGAWRNGEPGMIFLDEVNRNSPVLHVGEITATNPCGEQPLLPNESCNLGSIDVGKFAVEDEQGQVQMDWERLEGTIRTSIRLLDNVIDANKYALEEIRESTHLTRKLGLGVMGFADLLVKMNVPYDSDRGVEIGNELMHFLDKISLDESCKLAEERGPFPGWEGSEFQRKGLKVRNACRLTVAPTGTISMIAGASSGIEPLFSLAYRKQNILGGETLYYVNEAFEKVARERGFYDEDGDLMEFLADGGSLQEREDVPDDVKAIFRVSPDISPEYHVKMQAAFQESTDAAISKTINFPNEATVDDVRDAYMMSWQLSCKGITVYRAGSRTMEVLTKGHDKDGAVGETDAATSAVAEVSDDSLGTHIAPKERPQALSGSTFRMQTARGKLYVTINTDGEGQPMELFTLHGKAGGNDSAMAEAVSRLISLCLRCGIDPEEVVSQLRNITDEPMWDAGTRVGSVPDAIAIALERKLRESRGEGQPLEVVSRQDKMFGPRAGTAPPQGGSGQRPAAVTAACPECYGPISHEEGCLKCHSCGYSKC